MGIFDVFKTKVSEAADKIGDVAGGVADKAGDMAGDVKDKAEEMMGKGDDAASDAEDAVQDKAGEMPDGMPGATEDIQAKAEDMVSEGAPAAEAGGPASDGSGGLKGTIKDNAASGIDKAGEMADGATDGKFTDQINTGADKAKGMFGNG